VDFNASGAARVVTGQLTTTDNDLNVIGSIQTNPLTATVSDAIAVAVTPDAIPYGTATYTLQATVTFAGPVPVGPLTFSIDAVIVGAGTCTAASSTTETCTLTYNSSTLSVGVHTVTATEAADYNYIQTSNTDTGNLTVTPLPLALPQAALSTFASTPIGSTSAPVTITFTFQSSGSIGKPVVLTLGEPNLDYKDLGTGTCTTNGTAHVYVAGNTCTVNLTFTPTAVGQRLGSVLLPTTSNSGTPSANLAGLGTAPLVLFPTNSNPITLTSTAYTLPLFGFGGIVVDGKGDILFADQGNAAVKMLVATNGLVSSSSAVVTLGSGFSDPTGVAIDGLGNVFVCDYGSHQVKEIIAVNGVTSSTSQVVVLASGYTYLYGIAVDANENVFFADAASGTLNKLSPVNGIPPQTSVPTVIGQIYGGFGVKVDDSGDVFVGGGSYIQEFVAVNGAVTPSSAVNTFQDFQYVLDFAVDNAGNLFVSDEGIPSIVQFYPGNQYGGQTTVVNDDSPGGLALDGKGHLFALTGTPGGEAVQEIDLRTPPALTFPTTAPGATSAPQTVLFENEGNVNLILPVPTSGSNPSTSPAAFVLDPNFRCPTADAPDGPATLYVGQACGDQVTFAPTGAAGIITGQLVTTDNDLNAAGPAYAQQVVSLTGISTNPVSVLVTSITIAFGTPSVTLTATITYSGPAPTGAVTFTVDSIAAGTGTCTISSSTVRTCTVTYDSAVLSVGQHTIQATEAADYNYIQTSSSATNNFTVIPAPAATSQQTSNAFPTTAVGSTSAPVYLTFTFDQSESIAAPAVLTKGATGLDFKDAGTGTCTTNGTAYVYAPTSTCTVAVTFTPTLPGQRLGAVQLLSSSGTVLATTYIYGIGTGPLVTFPGDTVPAMVATGPSAPYGIAVDGKGDLFVAYTESGVVDEIVAVNGKVSASSTVIPIGSGFDAPYGIAVDGSGNVFVSDIFYNVVDEIVAVNGAVSASSAIVPLGSGFLYPEGLAVDAMGDVFVADNQNLQVKKISAINGTTSTVSVVGSGFRSPTGVAVDAMGDVFVADELTSQIKEIVASSGSVSASSPVNIVGSGFTYPIGVAVDSSGNVFVADTSGNAIQEIVAVNGAVSSTSTVNTLASGLDYPYAVAVDSSENLFFPNPNSAIDEIDFQTPPTLVFPTTAPGSTSAAQAVILQNSGNAALSFPAAVMGTNPSISTGYVIGAGSTCPQLSTSSPAATLAAGTNCTDSIAFAPVAGQSGTVDGQLISTDTNLNASSSMQTVPLTGTVTPTVSVTALSPNQGPIAGGTSVVITGTEFTGATAVLFGSTPATSFTVISATQITAITPPSAAGLVSVTVTTPIGTSPNSVQFLYVYPLKAFTVSGFPAPAILTEFGTVTVTAINSNNVADTTFIGTVTLSSTDPIATLPAPYTFQPSDNGTHTFTVYLNTKGTQSITATSGTVSGSQTGIVVSDAIWVLNANGQLTKLNVAGVPLLSGIVEPGNPASYGGVAFNHSQYAVPTGGLGIDPVYAVNNALNSLVMTDTQDGVEPGPAGYVQAEGNFSGGGVSGPSAIASDGAGFLWIANQFGNSISEFATTGIFVSPPSGFGSSYVVGDTFNQPSSIAIDQTGGVWVANKAGNSVTHVFGAAAPVPTPLSAATAAGTLGEKP
jgi:sugar lactone lactonase YvrE